MTSGSPDFWIRGKFIELIELISDITNVANVESIDLIDLITTISTITNIANIASIDLIDRITLIDEITEISKVRGLHWYDRNPTCIHKRYGGYGIAPHAPTTRWTYTVPADRKAYVEFALAAIFRRSAADLPIQAWASIAYQVSGESGGALIEAYIATNVAGDKDKNVVGHAILMLEGDTLEGATYDMSTGGTVDYIIIAKITEFDA